MSDEIQTTCEEMAARYMELAAELDLAIESGDGARVEEINSECGEMCLAAHQEMQLAAALEMRLMLLSFKAGAACRKQEKQGAAK